MTVAPVQVWAPWANDVEIEVDGQRVPLGAITDRPGWYQDQTPLPAGTDYWLVLDGRRLPDPLARDIPHGVHGPSRALDTAFDWSDDSWAGRVLSEDCVLYELHVGTFTPAGTFDGAAARLPELAELGITHVEVMPVAGFDGDRGWGYDGVALNAVHSAYGGPAGLVRFVDRAHDLGLGVLLDVVHNHLGPSGNYWPHFGPFFTDRHTTPWGDAVNLDGPGSDDVRAILIDSSLSWLSDYHLDGLRLDAVHELHDSTAFPYLEQLGRAVDVLGQQLGRPLTLIAESDRNDPATVAPVQHGGLGMTAQWDDDVHHALHWLLTDESHGYYTDFADPRAAADALERAFLHDGRWSSFRGRRHGRPVDFTRTPPWRFIAATQTHDQVGNRACGERLSHLAGIDRAAAGALLLLALPYTPMLFMGEDWAAESPWQFFTSFPDAQLGASVTQGRRAEFGRHGWNSDDVPDPQSPETFERSVLDWGGRDRPDGRKLVSWYRDLIAWRRRDLRGAPAPRCAWDRAPDGSLSWWAISRGRFLAVTSLAERPVVLTVPHDGLRARVRMAWSPTGALPSLPDPAGPVTLTLEPGSSVVLDVGRDRVYEMPRTVHPQD